MIELNSKTQQDFLNREWVQKLLDAGVDMSDAKYCICKIHDSGNPFEDPDDKDGIYYKDEFKVDNPFTGPAFIHARIKSAIESGTLDTEELMVPTYTVSELLYKLHEYIYPTINGEEYSGGLRFLKDAPFYIWYYKLINEDQTKADEDYIYAEAEYPIESLASLLIQCHQKDIGIKQKDTGNISDK